ncbi:MAG: hypothetical protein K9N06_11055 [Candidatus Cloacimonetes bacterium]|nr:hypothetical protein [Candidatus Cloacimonadota bacterium]
MILNKLFMRLLLTSLLLFPNLLLNSQNLKAINTAENYKSSCLTQNLPRHYNLGNNVNSGSSRRVNDFGEYDEEDSEKDDFPYFYLVAIVVMVPYFAPGYFLDDDFSDAYYYQNYPFENSNVFMDDVGRNWMANLSFSTQYIDEDVTGYQVKAAYRYNRFALEPSYTFYNFHKDEKSFTNFNSMLLLTFAHNYFINFRSGLGYSHFETDSKHDGIDYEYQISMFSKPIHIDLVYKLTGYNLITWSEIEYNNDFSIGLGYVYKRLEFNLGYNWDEMGTRYLKGPLISTVL